MNDISNDPYFVDEPPKHSRSVSWQKFLMQMIPPIERRVQTVSRAKALGYGRSLGGLAYHLAKKARTNARRGLRLAYGDAMTEAQREKLVRAVFEHFAMMAMDFLRGPLIQSPEDLNKLIVSVEGWEENVAPLMETGRGVIINTAHIGNWEFLGRYVVSRGLPMTVVARDPENPEFAAWARRMREGAGFSVSPKGSSVRKLLTLLKNGGAVGILTDQNSGDVFVPFFGIPTGTVTGPAVLAGRTNAHIISSWCLRDPNEENRYRLYFEPLVPTYDTGNKEEDYKRTITEVNQRLEARIRAVPDQWLWLHNRWKGTFEKHNRAKLPEGLDYTALWERYK